MAKLSDDQLAKRAATKRNNRLRKSMPLFAPLLTEAGPMSDWLTTPNKQKERIHHQHEEFKKIWATWEKDEKEFRLRGDERRAIIATHVDAETLAGLDQHYIRILGLYGPEYWADYWWGKLVKYVPKEAQERCPNKRLHEGLGRWHECCPTCGKPLAPCPTIERCELEQLRLFHPNEARAKR